MDVLCQQRPSKQKCWEPHIGTKAESYDCLLQEQGVTYVVGMTQARSNARVNIMKKYLVHEPFLFLVHNFTSHPDLAFGIPLEKLAVVGLPYYLE